MRSATVRISDVETRIKGWQLLQNVIKKLSVPSEVQVLGFKVHIDIAEELSKYYERLSTEQIDDLLLTIKAELVDYNGR